MSRFDLRRTRDCSAIVLLACASTATAQTQDAAGEDASRVENVVVTSSRIDRAGFEAPTPTVSLSLEDLSIGARPNIAAALNDMPQFRATTSPQTTGTNTSAGQAPVDLRGLGINRTLVLLDGRRMSSENDLNSIPSLLVKNVDIVTGGASAAWGSGAVAGVINVVMDRTFDGVKIGVESGISSYDDAEQIRGEAAFGTDFAGGRGHWVIGAEYLDNEGVIPKTSRPNIGRWATVSIGNGQYELMPDVGFANAARGGLILSGVNTGQVFNPDGTLRGFDYGTVVGTSSIGGEGPSNDDISPLVTPQRRYAGVTSVIYNINENLKFTADLRLSRMWNNYIWFGDHNRGNLTIGIDNAFLPDDVRDTMEAAGETSFTMGRFNSDLSYSSIDFERVTTQPTIALDGRFSGSWRWSAYYSHGEYENNIDTPGFLLTQNYADSVDSVIDSTTGSAICRVALSDPTSDCVPINLFGEGSPSQEAIDYVTGTPSMRSTTKLNVGGFSLRGEPFSLPAGAVSIAVGADARKESVNQTVGELDTAKAFTTFSFSPMSGEYSVKEGFAEILAPIVRDRSLMRNLEFNAAARLSDYDTTGSIWSWKLGATNEIFEGLRGRITRSRDIRSANLTELYTQTTTGYNTVTDPFTNSSVYVLTNGGGNENLTPEEADTLTLGLTWSPPSAPGLRMSLDYYDISISDVITTVSAQDILTRCYNGNPDMCARIERDGSGNLTRIVSTYTNLAKYKMDGGDAEVSYSIPLDRIISAPGRLQFRVVATWVDSLTTNDGVSEIEYVKSQGYSFGLGVPRLRINASVGYQGDVVGANLRALYISAGEYNSTVNIVNNAIPSYTYFDLGVRANLSRLTDHDIELYGNVTNLFDKDPPVSSLYSPYYDVVGRYVSVGVRGGF